MPTFFDILSFDISDFGKITQYRKFITIQPFVPSIGEFMKVSQSFKHKDASKASKDDVRSQISQLSEKISSSRRQSQKTVSQKFWLVQPRESKEIGIFGRNKTWRRFPAKTRRPRVASTDAKGILAISFKLKIVEKRTRSLKLKTKNVFSGCVFRQLSNFAQTKKWIFNLDH
jgi:hypothetical protein